MWVSRHHEHKSKRGSHRLPKEGASKPFYGLELIMDQREGTPWRPTINKKAPNEVLLGDYYYKKKDP